MIAHHPRSKQHLKTREFQAVRSCQQVGRVTGQESLPSTLFLLFATRATVHGHSKPVPGSYLRSTGKPMVTTTSSMPSLRRKGIQLVQVCNKCRHNSISLKIPQTHIWSQRKSTHGPWLQRLRMKVCQEKDSNKLRKHNSNHFNCIPKSLRFFTIGPFSQKTKVSKVLLSTKGHS